MRLKMHLLCSDYAHYAPTMPIMLKEYAACCTQATLLSRHIE